ncbi:S8 family serine peptidase [Microbacterium sp. zg-Y818]|uniref:S8 family peptidase n=1 Tax=unclassified Microbacterium TaxID=2609290 RepID=UPI00214B8CB2|nr:MULTISPECIES: S8 family serine peptidase [unclassified Microbacterium]MCR2802043.1 S8 family serine peptidase [Microbacterium sp. zg.Y818]WIM22593.1 S8 family serine peptidase [Microbacterium sp. zg-Y818]
MRSSKRHGDAGRRASRAVVVALAAALVVVGPSSVATASTAPAPLWWWDTYGIDALHEQGWTGDGVRIAVMDTQINPDVPAFEERDLTVADGTLCAEGESAVSAEATRGAVHGTTVTAMLIGTGEGAGGVRGIVPDAEVTFYGLGVEAAGNGCTTRERPDELSPFGLALQRAIDDGAQIFTTSVGSPLESEVGDGAVIAEAIAKGIVILNSTANPGSGLTQNSLGLINGVLAVSAVDSSGELQTDDAGQPFALEETHVVSAGVALPSVGVTAGAWEQSGSTSGSSLATPLVAGMLALLAQQHPEATGNQLVQALLHSTNGSIHAPTYEPETGYGYGAAWPASLLQSDPTSYPDESPLMDRPYGIPSAEQVADAVARESGASPEEDAAPVPADEDAATAPVQADPLGPLGPAGIAVSVGLVAVVVAGIITALVIVVRRKGPRRGATP